MDEQVTETAAPESNIESMAEQVFEGLGFDEAKDTSSSPSPSPESAPEGKGTELQSSDPTQSPQTDDPSQSKAASPSAESASNPPSGATPPDTWSKEAQAEFAKLPPQVQAEVTKREGDIARYVAQTNERVKMADGFERMLAPHMQTLNQYGVNPWQYVDTLIKSHQTLLFGAPEHKAHLAFALLKDAGIDVSKLAGGNPLDAITPPNAENARLQARIHQLEQMMTGVSSDIQAQRLAETEQDVAAFAADPANQYFNEVAPEIATLLKSGVCKTLKDAYDKAVWANPVVRQKEIARLNGEAQKRAEQQRKQQLDTSRRAARVNVSGLDGSGGAARDSGNWERGMADTLKEIRERQNA